MSAESKPQLSHAHEHGLNAASGGIHHSAEVTQPTDGGEGAQGRSLRSRADLSCRSAGLPPQTGKGRGRTRQVRTASLMEPYAILAMQFVVRSDGIQSTANLAALMAPEDQKSMHLQR